MLEIYKVFYEKRFTDPLCTGSFMTYADCSADAERQFWESRDEPTQNYHIKRVEYIGERSW